MVEKEIEVVVLASNIEMILASHEGEALPEFEQKILDAIDQCLLEMSFVRIACNLDEVENVGILEQIDRHRPGDVMVDVKFVIARPWRS